MEGSMECRTDACTCAGDGLLVRADRWVQVWMDRWMHACSEGGAEAHFAEIEHHVAPTMPLIKELLDSLQVVANHHRKLPHGVLARKRHCDDPARNVRQVQVVSAVLGEPARQHCLELWFFTFLRLLESGRRGFGLRASG